LQQLSTVASQKNWERFSLSLSERAGVNGEHIIQLKILITRLGPHHLARADWFTSLEY
jgi:hypothetical protein